MFRLASEFSPIPLDEPERCARRVDRLKPSKYFRTRENDGGEKGRDSDGESEKARESRLFRAVNRMCDAHASM